MEEYERNIHRHIEQYGCSVTSVFDPEGSEPPFSYSIGIAKTAMAPELIIVGLKPEISHWLVNEYNRRVKAGERFVPGISYSGFLKGFDVRFGPVAPEHRKEYMRSATWFHDGSDFDALQLIWPSRTGAWPWDPEAGDAFRARQPLLSSAESEP